ncbi:hypothetical protein ACO0K9_03885 [Undibacterium sp. Ji50W]|uniref:hypothetical protein n=1 Tax=Undibacterium sp. Ji50W TaxID=3413041 RepID=UPI003BF35687
MQNLIASLLLLLASVYLLLKYMPKATKNRIKIYFQSLHPALVPVLDGLSKQSDGCGSGCGGCASNNTASNNHCSKPQSPEQTIKLIKNLPAQK